MNQTQFALGDTTAIYVQDTPESPLSLWLVPTALLGQVERLPSSQTQSAPLIQLRVRGEEGAGRFLQGRSTSFSPSTLKLRLERQELLEELGATIVRSHLSTPSGLHCQHDLQWAAGTGFLRVNTRVHNPTEQPFTLELLSSFSLAGMTPFASDDAANRLTVHRFRSAWSAEGRAVSEPLEVLQLDRVRAAGGPSTAERFGQVGTMPVRGWFPFCAVEDSIAGVTWGAQLAWAGSWQLELNRRGDSLNLCGGLADRELGHWSKTLAGGETFETPEARLSVVQGGLDAVCDRLLEAQELDFDAPTSEEDLPIQFNEWCTSWGKPTHANLVALAEKLRGTPVRYLVIDAGWYGKPGRWESGHGEWQPYPEAFPDGLEVTAAAIRECGLIPGLWFEAETVGRDSKAFQELEHLLHLDGLPMTVAERRFWNLSDPWTQAYLTQRVAGLLERGGFGYLKVDYNETLGIGCDGAESPGEGLRQQVHGTYRFFERLRTQLPDLVIENCASGGHRLEPSMTARSSLSSFSDAHEDLEIPVIAANLHRLILPRQSLIWAVLRQTDDQKRLVYSLVNTFLGRMCISGDALSLDSAQWETVTRAMNLYTQAHPLLKTGRSSRVGSVQRSYRKLEGWQGVLRVSDDQTRALVVLHSFADAPKAIEMVLPEGIWQLEATLESGGAVPTFENHSLHWTPDGDWSACVALLRRREI